MCGFIGILFSSPVSNRLALTKACDAMRRRGPDAEGEWWSSDGSVGLGHRRLAILDLDARADQPMLSRDERYIIVFNGEIYNFKGLRQALESEGVLFHTTSDTEVLLTLFAREGATMLSRLRGMFAFAIWDNEERELFVARDPYGIKPLYIATTSQAILVGSQVKALLATGLVSRAPNPLGIAGFWLLGSVPEPHTCYRDIRALSPGHYAILSEKGIINQASWWDIGRAWCEADGIKRPEGEIRERVRDSLRASVKAHLVADVPVGVFLSGGIDSGAMAAFMVQEGALDLQGITLTYREFAGRHEDEAPIAANLARQYGIKHYVRTVTRKEFEADLPRILQAMDQPSIDGINTWYAAKALAELGLKVVVSGVGGDELFQGYDSFSQLPRLMSLWRWASRFPGVLPLSRWASTIQARRTANPRWNMLPELATSIEGWWFLRRGLFSPQELPGLLGTDMASEVLHDFNPISFVHQMTGKLASSPRLALSQIESMVYLRNQLLRDSDWASMDHSVELRTPLVDAWLLRDMHSLFGSFQHYPNKRLLAQSPNHPLPEEILVRKKTGFGIPVRKWLIEMGVDEVGEGMSRGWAKHLMKTINSKLDMI
jgi:asparagine synthase (glutamine-hydrolysing)